MPFKKKAGTKAKTVSKPAAKKTTTKPPAKGQTKPEKKEKGKTLPWTVTKTMDSEWKKHRKEKPKAGMFESDDVPDGDYVVKISNMKFGAFADKKEQRIVNGKKQKEATYSNNGNPVNFLEVQCIIVKGEYRGSKLKDMVTWRGDKEQLARSNDRLKGWVTAAGYDYEEIESAEEMPELFKSISEEKPVAVVRKKKTTSKGKDYINVYPQRPAKKSEVEEATDDEEETEDEEVEDDDAEETEDEETEESDEDESEDEEEETEEEDED